MLAKAFDPKTQRLSYASGSPKPYTLPKLTDLQLAALACVRDDAVERYERRVGFDRYVAYRSNGFDVTCQMQSLKKRRLIRFSFKRDGVFILTDLGIETLAQYPEF